MKKNRYKKLLYASKYPRRWLYLWSNCGQMIASLYTVPILESRRNERKADIEEEKKEKKSCRSPSQVTSFVKTGSRIDGETSWSAVANRKRHADVLSPRRVES